MSSGWFGRFGHEVFPVDVHMVTGNTTHHGESGDTSAVFQTGPFSFSNIWVTLDSL